MTLEAMQQFMERFGVVVALLLLFVYLDIKRRKREDKKEDQLIERMCKLEDHTRDKLEGLIKDNTVALEDHAKTSKELMEVSREHTSTFRAFNVALRTRPCLSDALDVLDRRQGT